MELQGWTTVAWHMSPAATSNLERNHETNKTPEY